MSLDATRTPIQPPRHPGESAVLPAGDPPNKNANSTPRHPGESRGLARTVRSQPAKPPHREFRHVLRPPGGGFALRDVREKLSVTSGPRLPHSASTEFATRPPPPPVRLWRWFLTVPMTGAPLSRGKIAAPIQPTPTRARMEAARLASSVPNASPSATAATAKIKPLGANQSQATALTSLVPAAPSSLMVSRQWRYASARRPNHQVPPTVNTDTRIAARHDTAAGWGPNAEVIGGASFRSGDNPPHSEYDRPGRKVHHGGSTRLSPEIPAAERDAPRFADWPATRQSAIR